MPSDLYLYLDETGSLGLSGDAYFGLGQAMFAGETTTAEWEGTKLRFDLERSGVRLPKGFTRRTMTRRRGRKSSV